MVTPGVTTMQISAKTRPATYLLSLSYWVVCVLGVVVLEGDVLAAEDPIKEVVLPVGLSSAQSIAVDVKGRVWFTEKVGRKLALFEPSTGEFTTHALPSAWGSLGFSQFALSPDGAIWFTRAQMGRECGRASLPGKVRPK